MKPYHVLFLFIFLITSCAPAVSAPTVTAIPPTQTNTAIPTSTNTPEPTVTETLEPTATATLEPTKVPMPNGWMSIAETKEIGGRQVVVNDKGEGATQIDGEWYPVDIIGCYYKEFFDPANQTDPLFEEIIQKINSETSMTYEFDDHDWRRNRGTSWMAYPQKGKYPRYVENHVDSILYEQMLCYNKFSLEWVHVVDYIHSYYEDLMPENTKRMRSTVGWLRDGSYWSFTYKQKGEENSKANSIQEGFQLWKSLIEKKEQVVLGIPFSFAVNNLGHWPEKEYEPAIRNLVSEAPQKHPEMWKIDLSDERFIEWTLSEKNQVRYWSDNKNSNNSCQEKRTSNRCWGELAADGKYLDIVTRIILVK